mgnify:CR=1 FL=1
MNPQKTNSVRNSKSMNSWLFRLSLASVLLFSAMPASAKYGGGSGALGDPYLIATPEQLYDIGKHEEDWDKFFKLTADIDLSAYKGIQYNPIGIEYGRWFLGVFDGDGHTISNFTFHSQTLNVGLFGFVHGTVKNVGLISVDVSGYQNVGGVAGNALRGGGNPGLISNCYVTGRVSGQYDVGVFV